jgi:hypothetical protein
MQKTETCFKGLAFYTSSGLFEDFDKNEIINFISRPVVSINFSEKSDREDHVYLVIDYSDGEYSRHYVPVEHKERVYNWMKGVMLWLNDKPEKVKFVSLSHVTIPDFKLDTKSTYFEMLVDDIVGVVTGQVNKDSIIKIPTWYLKITTKKEDIFLYYLDVDTRNNMLQNILLAKKRQEDVNNGKRQFMPTFNCMDGNNQMSISSKETPIAKLSFDKTVQGIFHSKGFILGEKITNYWIKIDPDNKTAQIISNTPEFQPYIPFDKAEQVRTWMEEVMIYSHFPRDSFIFEAETVDKLLTNENKNKGKCFIDLDTVSSFESYAAVHNEDNTSWMIKLQKVKKPDVPSLDVGYFSHRAPGQDYFLLQFENEQKWKEATTDLTILMRRKNNWNMGIRSTGIGCSILPNKFAW